MRYIDQGHPTGVIAPPVEEVAASMQAGSMNHVQPATVLDALQNSPAQAILDLPLPQLPADLPPIEPPAFVLSRKITEDAPALGTFPAGMPGLAGNQAPDASHILSGLQSDVSSVLSGADTAIHHAAAPAFDAAQNVLTGAQGALNGLRGGAPAASVPTATAPGAAPTAGVPNAAMPADPVAALLQGLQLPALPGIDLLFKPILDMLSSFGTGVIGALDPTKLLAQSSKIIELAMQVGKGSIKTVDQLWQGQAARTAQASAQKATAEGQETSQRGFDISELTTKAAAVVQKGNAELATIATSFATQAAALAPVILTPPAQTALIATATEHVGQAVGVVNATRGELAGHTAELNGVVQQLVGRSGLPAPQEVAQAVAQNIAEPILSQAKETAQSATENATKAAGLGDQTKTTTPNTTTPASVTTPHSPGTSPGSPSSSLLGSRSGTPGRLGAPGSPGSPKPSGLPGSTIPGVPMRPGVPEAAALRGGVPGTGATGTGSGFMGAPGAAGQRGGDEEHSRHVQPYQSPSGNSDLTGPLGESTPDVIGATHPDEVVGSDYEQDQF
ncbi:hypothetical protein [Nocardia sp. NPDC052566]|uniref:hypothetical protein n=1 Tax=Nocardia sp. NPDC052566 TaxID=3364330 RepID=UPI0037CA57A8